ncbi:MULTISPECIES: glycosyltransferase family 4 protein [Alphaproteobacteria]|uniref:Glycosyl transferase family 1 n=2 Tax=Alphaproteobacteria TaxID=28211 RepID=A0A512HEJ9_9HYPH|nr:MULTISPECIES: glycosyltransferase family 4 protein [Alphaproteobacteria]GEO83883.1 glycosyl transferase family 1 [Ciceribacter naphthalenivorans]GLR21239.1 glycosyl transferase family 1 [Ciceribacter naphthalenivorans]GLT04095.1 glycosyl transferase family 1 [Sphingomonas psychrolutea]
MRPLDDITVIAPHFKRRLSGVTSTVVQLIPEQRRIGRGIVTLGPGLPDDLPKMAWNQLPALWRRPKSAKNRVWHARRNNEMLLGIILRDVLRMPLKLLFTSAAQRHHTGYTRWLISKMDAVVATSARSGSFLKVPHEVIRHGVDINRFRPGDGTTDTVEATGLPGQYLVGCFGRVRHQKGTDLFVRAMIELLPRYPEWTAVVSGRVTGENQGFADQLQADIAAAGLASRIVFLGEVDDIKPWYRRLTLYIAPSRNEGFGLTPLEAMASATASVASDAGAYAELIAEGETGKVVPANDFERLRDAIAVYLADPAEAIKAGQRGRAHVVENFALEREARALEMVYNQLLDAD